LKIAVMDQPASTVSPSLSASWIMEQHHGWQWYFPADLSVTARSIFREPDWARWMAHPAVTVVKPARRRTVIRIDRTGEMPAVYCKRFLNGSLADGLRAMLRGSPAQWEASRIKLALARGIPTAEIQGYGVRRQRRLVVESRLFLAAIEPTISLADLCSRTEVPDVILPEVAGVSRTVWVPVVAELLAQLHGRGLWHGDLHGGNILLQPTSSGCRPWLIDLTALRGGVRCPRPQLIGNLARFWLSIERAWTPTDRELFVQHYWQQLSQWDAGLANSLGTTVEQVMRELDAAIADAVRPIHRRADLAWERGGSRLWMRPHGRALMALGEPWIQSAMAQIDQWWSQGEVVPTRTGLQARRCTIETPVGPRTCRLVRYVKSRRGQRWSSARCAWEWGHALHRRGVTVAVPWLMFENDTVDFLLACEPEGSCPLISTSTVIERVQTLLRQIHSAGFSWSELTEDVVRQSVDQHAIAWCALELLQRRPAANPEWEIQEGVTRLTNASTATA